jgi:DNA-binding CsgD family transcriptional regulator
VNLATMLETVDALCAAATAAGEHPLSDEEFVDALVRLIPSDWISFVDLDVEHASTVEDFELLPTPPASAGAEAPFWEHFWDSLICSYPALDVPWAREPRTTQDFYSDRQWRANAMYADVMAPGGIEWELVLPLPSPPGRSRRLVFFRGPGPAFADDHRVLAALLRPHLAEGLRRHDRSSAAAVLTPRQREMLGLCAQGMDNVRIARRLGMSVGTVRKHLENTFVRLGVSSRGQAVAAVHPDLTWV